MWTESRVEQSLQCKKHELRSEFACQTQAARQTAQGGAGRPRRSYNLSPLELYAGRVVSWELDVDNPVHMRVLREFLSSLEPQPGTARCHLHTSPPCTPFSRVQYLNLAKGVYKSRQRAVGVRRIRAMRRLHAVVRQSDVVWTSSHEQPEGSTMSHVHGAQSWPWAVRRSAARQRVVGCAVGLRSASGYSRKVWVFESDCPTLLSVLSRFGHCPGGHQHGRMAASCTECYPASLGAIIAGALCYRPGQ